jgi:hypothetical protein
VAEAILDARLEIGDELRIGRTRIVLRDVY